MQTSQTTIQPPSPPLPLSPSPSRQPFNPSFTAVNNFNGPLLKTPRPSEFPCATFSIAEQHGIYYQSSHLTMLFAELIRASPDPNQKSRELLVIRTSKSRPSLPPSFSLHKTCLHQHRARSTPRTDRIFILAHQPHGLPLAVAIIYNLKPKPL